MATPLRVYRQIAQWYGNIDPTDTIAVRKSFQETLPRKEVMDETMAHDGESDEHAVR